MSGSTRRRLKSEISRGSALDDADEGSAARTRPLSYDEIMLKRKSKKEIDGFREEAREVKNTRVEGCVMRSGYNSRDVDPDVLKSSREYAWEDSSRKKEDKMSRKENIHGKSKNKESHDVEGRSKNKHEKDVRNAADTLKDSRVHGRSKLDEYSRDDSRYDNERRRHRDSVAQDKHMERSRGAPEREIKRKDRSGEDEKYRLRDSMKKHDSGNRRDSEMSERKEKMDASYSCHDETRSKRRRSRSQGRVKDKGRRSRSSSPKTHKKVSSHGLDLDQLSLHSHRDKSRHHSDIERNKMSSNGSASHHRRNGGSSSGLGGYSPRKRKTEAAIKTPSPIRSPERRSAGWDLPPSGGDGNLNASVASAPQLVSQIQSSHISELAGSVSVTSTMAKPLSAILSSNLSAFNATSIDSIQLTQATRPMRRLYIDNIPSSASERDVMEYFNDFLLSSGANHVRGTRPCISCMIHKEKGQALVEFLTPEDASAALYFDGRSLLGSIVKIRRPKDFVEVTSIIPAYEKNKNKNKNDDTTTTQSGTSERSKCGVDAIGNVVKDSPYKIFIGGIAEGLSSAMIMEIVSVFGPLKAYHFEINADLNERCAFMEYADQSVTLKACAGLNGLKIGGRVLTVAQAVPNTSSMENYGNTPFYGIPEHVKPLLEMATPVLKLNNVLDHNALELFSETDLEEIVEDVRLECSRFGSVVSINVVKTSKIHITISETEVTTNDKLLQPLGEKEVREHPVIGELVEGVVDHGGCSEVEPSGNVKELDIQEAERNDLAPVTATTDTEMGAPGRSTIEEIQETDKIAPHDLDSGAAADHPPESIAATVGETGRPEGSDVNHQDVPVQGNGVGSEFNPDEIVDIDKSIDNGTPSAEDVPELNKASDKLQDVGPVTHHCTTSNQGAESGAKNENDCDIQNVFEAGCILVEFRRAEASCMAAHCLHGRVFDDRLVTVQYVPFSAYRARFPK